LYEARRALRRIERLLVVEGYMDVVALAQAGIPNAVATLGTASGAPHFEKLFRQTAEVVCCFDGDQAGRDAAWKALVVALPTLTAGHQLSFVFLPDGEDPDSLVRKEGKQKFGERIGGALGAAEYLFQHLSGGLDLSTMDGRARLAELALPYLKTIPDGVLRELAMERLATIARVSPDALVRGAKVVRQAPLRPKQQARGLSRLSERLLAILLKHPEYLKSLDEQRRARLVGMADSLLGNVVRYFAGQPDADLGSLLGYWAGQDGHAALVELADRPLVLSGEALTREFDDAVTQCLAAIERANRRAFLDVLRAEGSTEALARYWSLKRQAD
jgi:DNA primase